MTKLFHPDRRFEGSVYLGVGVADFKKGEAEVGFTLPPATLARLKSAGYHVGARPVPPVPRPVPPVEVSEGD